MGASEPEPSVHILPVIVPQVSFRFCGAARPYWVNEEKGGCDSPNACKHAKHIDKLPSYLIIMSLNRWLCRCCTGSVRTGIAGRCCVLELVYSMVSRSEKIHEESAAFFVII